MMPENLKRLYDAYFRGFSLWVDADKYSKLGENRYRVWIFYYRDGEPYNDSVILEPRKNNE